MNEITKSSVQVPNLPEDIRAKVRLAQQVELTEYFIYRRLARSQRDPNVRKVLERIAEEEREHHDFWKRLLGKSVRPRRLRIIFYTWLARLFGITFGIKLMEKGEKRAERHYEEIRSYVPQVEELIEAENEHEQNLIALIDEERLRYVSSMVLGLNDALVELTGALAGLTLALQKTHIVALAGLITGIAAALSMAASEYLSTKSEEGDKNPVKAAGYTGVAYIFTVLFLVFPYLVLPSPFLALGWAVVNAMLVVVLFTFYISVAKDLTFRHRFAEMAAISLSVTAINFLIGLAIRSVFHIEV